MDFLSGLAKAAQSKPTSDQPDDNQEKSSNYDLYGSAKVVADAAQSQFRNEPEKYDKGKVAGATADLLGAASDYGKLDDTKGVGKYVDQAEGYLRHYGTPQTTTPTHKSTLTDSPAADYVDDKPVDLGDDKEAQGFLNKPSDDAQGDSAGGYIKKAQGFLNKPSDEAEGGGEGDYINKAEGFLNKPSEEGGEGDYINKTEDQFFNKSSKDGAEGTGGTAEHEFLNKPSDGGTGDYVKKVEHEFLNKPSDEAETGGGGDYTDKEEEFPTKPSSGDGGEKSEGGYGGLMKMAGGGGDYTDKAEEFLTKPSSGDCGEKSEGGYGGLMKMAGGFMKK